MADVAVVAHSRKSLGGGLPELRRILALEGVTDPLWYEVKKSRRAPEYAKKAAAKGADVMFVWGGDGTVQRCIDAVAETDTAVAILPAGTANLLAANLNVPHDLTEAVRAGLHGDRRRLDTGSVNGERFTVNRSASNSTAAPARPARNCASKSARARSRSACRPAGSRTIPGYPEEESNAITLLMPFGLPKISSAACSGG